MIVITGKNGYIGSYLKKYLEKRGCEVCCKDVRGSVKDDIFGDADIVIHTAGIVHNKKADAALYKSVNADLTERLALIAKKSGVRHFIFFSTMSVYGLVTGEISKNTPERPKNDYGKSKLEAEKRLFALKDKDFKITVIRPPVVYGKNCPGNYRRLSKIAKILKVFPDTKNKKSMIYIENLAKCVEDIIKGTIEGVVLPQNEEYVNTAKMCECIAKNNNKKLYLSKMLGRIVIKIKIGVVQKAFGNLYYTKDISYLCNAVGFEESIEVTEK